jgi:hypothetical protein
LRSTEKKMDEKRYALPIPRGITTGIIFEAAERFGLEVDQEQPPDDAFDIRTDLPIKDYVPRIRNISSSGMRNGSRTWKIGARCVVSAS